METSLRRWWTEKYRLPITSDAWLDSSFSDLIVEFFEDAFDKDDVSRHTHVDEHGRAYLQIGDPYYDKWERDLAEGRPVNLWESFTPAQKRVIEGTFKKDKPVINVMDINTETELDNFKETY